MRTTDDRQYWTYDKADQIYREDQMFRVVVDSLCHIIEQLRLTPGEVRSAATYACIRWEMRHPRPIYVDIGEIDPEVLAQMRKP